MTRFARRAASSLFVLRDRICDWASPAPPCRRGRWLAVERLEDRTTPTTITWANAAGGSWHTPGNWDLNRVPAAGDDVVIPDLTGAQTITFSTGSTSVTSVESAEEFTLSGGVLDVVGNVTATSGINLGGGTLKNARVTAGTSMIAGGTLDGVTVDGDIQVRGNNTLTVRNGLTLNGIAWVGDGVSTGRISVEGAGPLGGTGTVWFTGPFTGVLAASAPGGVLTIGPGVTVRGGSGTVGRSDAGVDIRGTVLAETTAITVQGTNWTSSGTLRATSGGQIVVSGTVANAGNTMTLDGGGAFSLGGTVTGGKIRVTGGAAVAVGATLDGVTVDGDIQVRGNNTLTVRNGLTLNGIAWVGDGVSTGRISVEGAGPLGGTGTVWFTGPFTGVLSASGIADVLTVGPGVTVRGGSGILGSNTTGLDIRGTVLAETATALTIQGTNWTSSGTLRATGNGSISLAGTVANTGRVLALDGNGAFGLGANVTGGTIRVTGGASVAVGATLDGVTVDGDIQVRGNNTLTVRNGLTLNGIAWVGDGVSTGRISVEGAGPLGGTGTVWFTGPFTGVLAASAPGGVLTIGHGVTVRGGSGIVGRADAGLDIRGTVLAETTAVTVQGTNWTSSGTLRAITGGTIVGSGALSNYSAGALVGGTYEVGTNSTIQLPIGTVSVLGATVRLNGLNARFDRGDGQAVLQGALAVSVGGNLSLATGGTLSLSSLQIDGTVVVAAGNSIAVAGGFHQTGSGTLELAVGGTPASGLFGRVTTGTANLGGRVRTRFVNGFGPTTGQAFAVLTYGTRTGTFATAETPFFGVGYEPTAVVLNATTTAGDLAVTNVSGPPAAAPGQAITVTYTVVNQSSAPLSGSWQDSVYLSADGVYDSSDLLLRRVVQSRTLTVGGSYTETFTVTLPATAAGPYRLLVVTDSRGQVTDTDRANNTRAAAAVTTLAVPSLTLGTPRMGTIRNGESLLYRLDLDAGRSVTVTGTFGGVNQAEFYVRYGQAPTRSVFDFAANSLAELRREILIRGPQAGTYYILLYGREGAFTPVPFTLLADYEALRVTATSPNAVWIGGNATVTLSGAAFPTNARVFLTLGGGEREAVRVNVRDSGTLFATFDTRGWTPGSYSVRVFDPSANTSAALPAAVAVSSPPLSAGFVLAGQPAPSPRPAVRISSPSAIRGGSSGLVTVDISNESGFDQPAPLILVSADNADLRLPGDTQYVGQSVQVLGINTTGEAGTLPPGYRGTIQIEFRPRNVNAITFTASRPLADSSLIDWGAIKPDLRPANIAPDAWDAIYSVFLAQVGTTAGQYTRVLAENATALSNLGVYTADVARLLAFELQQASAQLPASSLASAVDASAPVPGLPLAFARTYAQPIAGRYAVGALGRGWSHAWELTAATDAAGNVTLQNAGAARFFRKSGSTFVPTAGDYATLTLTGGAYRLRETDGSVFQFRPDGKLDSVEDANGNRVTATYTGGRLTQLAHSSGAAFALAYNAFGRLATLTDQAGRVTSYAYDGTGQYLLSVTGPRGTTAYTYETAGTLPQRHALRTITDPTGASVAFTYDAAGRLVRQAQTNGTQAVTFTYDSAAGLTVRDQTGSEVKLLFDDAGQVRKVIDPLGNASRFGFDAAGNLTAANAPQGLSSTFAYDARGNPTTSTDPLGSAIGTTFDPSNDRLTSLTNPNGGRLAYGYDARGNLTSITYADGSRETFTYDGVGNVLTSTNRRGQTVGYAYDARGLLTQKVTPEGTTTYAYDARGHLTAATSLLGTWTLAYDTADRLTRYEQPGGRFLQFTYDAAGRRTRSVDQDGVAVNYRYDAQGRLAELTDAANARIVLYAYDTAGLLARKDNGNGTYTAYGYDAAGRLTSLANHQPDGDVNSSFAYAYDLLGRQTAVTDETGGVTRYGYDANGQLTRVELPTGRVIEYRYDRNGNRTSVIDNGVATDYATDTLDQYTAVGTNTLGYDRDGNLTSEVGPGTARGYQYSSENRLIGLIDAAAVSTFEYDPFGNRVAAVLNGVRTEYQIDPAGLGNVVAEFGAGGAVTRYTHGIGLTRRTAAGGTSYFDFNYVGSTVGLTDAAGGYVNRYAYLPFGERLTVTEGVANDFEYVGQWGVMKSGGTEYMRARQYQTASGRFSQMDPIGLQGESINLQGYGNNSPLHYIDPLGLAITPIIFYFPPQPESKPLLDCPPNIRGMVSIPTGWKEYHGKPEAFHCNLFGILEDRLPTRYSPQNECFYDHAGDLVTTRHILRGCRGTPNYYDSEKNPWLHGFVDVARDGLFALITSGLYAGVTRIQATTRQLFSFDPNDILHPYGVGPGLHVAAGQTLAYTIRFENLASATAAAAQVVVTHTLDDDLDLHSFALGEIGFGGAYGLATFTVTVPGGRAVYSARLDLRATLGIFADVSAELNLATRVVTWTLTAIDPLTGDIPADPARGLLPPNDATGRGEGYVTFIVRAKPGTPSGSRIDAQARIVFDNNAPIDTPAVFNTVDAGPPTSAVNPLPTQTTTPAFVVSWAGQDEPGGSGLATYDVYVSVDGGAYTLWLDNTTLTSAVYAGDVGRTYRFFSTATDLVGYEELPPAMEDAIVTVVSSPPVSPPPPATPPIVVRYLPVGGRGSSVVRLTDVQTGAEVLAFDAFPGFGGGANVATGDVTGDGVADFFVGAAAGGGPHVKLFDGAKLLAGFTPDAALVYTFYAYDVAFAGGVNVALGDVTGDGLADMITGAGAGGGPHVKVFDGRTGAEVASFYAYDEAFRGGVHVAAADFNGDGKADVVTGAGLGGGPHVKVIDATRLWEQRSDGVIADSALLANFFAYDTAFAGGVSVTAGDVNGDGQPEVITGAGTGGGPHVKAFDTSSAEQASFFAFDADDRGGVNVAFHHTQVGPRLLVGSLGGRGVRLFSPPTLDLVQEWDEESGVYVG